jgi:DNA-binding PadR family transcriptional regulator
VSRGDSAPSLTTTSFAILGLLAIRPWTTYELALQMERTLYRTWPRARSRLYEEPKKLVAHGLAVATKDAVGRRPRTVYTITAAGRRALADWLATPGEGPSLEYEQHVKLFFADFGTRTDALATLAASRAWAAAQLDVFVDSARDYLAGSGPFPERSAVTSLGARFLVDFYDLVDRWAAWATTVVDGWPEDPSRAEPTLAVDEYIVALAERRKDEATGPSGGSA